MDQIPPEQMAILARENHGPLTKAIIITFTILALISVSLRLFTRFNYSAIGWEDYTIVFSMLMSIGTAVFQLLQVNAGSGKHAMFIPFPAGVEKMLWCLFWSIIFYNFSLMFTKVSILLQYGRIFTVREMRIPLHLTMGFCVAWGITTTFTQIFACIPVQAYWKILEQASAKCVDSKTIWYANASINILTDLLVATLPIRVIWGLQIPKRQKIALLCILTIGWFVCIVSIVRLHALIVLAANPTDQSWYGSATAYWSSIEMNLAIVCASLPALKPLIVKIVPGFSTRHSNRGAYGTGMSGRYKNSGFGSKATRTTEEEDMELANKSFSCTAYPATSGDSVRGENIYVTHNLEQHFEENAQASDSESQKDLVTTPGSVLAKD